MHNLLQLLPTSVQQQGPSDRHGRKLPWWKVTKPPLLQGGAGQGRDTGKAARRCAVASLPLHGIL